MISCCSIIYSKRHNKFLFSAFAEALYESFYKAESEIFNVFNYNHCLLESIIQGINLLYIKLFHCIRSKRLFLLPSRLYCWFWTFTKSATSFSSARLTKTPWVADCTASREFHPAPKNFSLFTESIVALFLSGGNRKICILFCSLNHIIKFLFSSMFK